MSVWIWGGLGIFSILLFIKKYVNYPFTPHKRNMLGQVVIVTGSSAGIGKQTAKSLLESGATVVFANRDENKTKSVIANMLQEIGQDKQANAIFIKLDTSSFASVINFAKQFHSKFDKLDILINNAGASFLTYKKTEDEIESTWQVNHLSSVLLTALLLDKISNSKDGRIINVSSSGHKHASLTPNYFEFKPENFFCICS